MHGDSHYEYDAFGRRIAKTNGLEQAEVYYYHLDHLGTPQELTNAKGDLVWSVTYRAYGNVVQQQVAEIDNPLRFQSQYHDPETGLHYNRHRYYNPNTGRFITPDPIGLAGGLNNYQYVPNPTGWVDPLGLVSQPKSAVPSGVPLTSDQVKEIQSINRGSRPDPGSYLPASYINSHLAQFDGGGSRLTPKSWGFYWPLPVALFRTRSRFDFFLTWVLWMSGKMKAGSTSSSNFGTATIA